MKSIVSLLGNENFPRLRFGIESRGLSAPAKQETTSFVLEPFLKTEKKELDTAIDKAVCALKTIINEGLEKTMNTFN